jgi:hypothetical protein
MPTQNAQMITEYRRGDRHVYRHVAGEHLLIALHRDTVAPLFVFTPTAAALWQWLDAWLTPDALLDRLCERFDCARDDAARDLAAFLEQLALIGAVELRERAP